MSLLRTPNELGALFEEAGDGDVVAGCEPDVDLVGDELHARHRGQLFGRAVARTVIDDDPASGDLQFGERLETGDRVGDPSVVEHDDADAIRATYAANLSALVDCHAMPLSGPIAMLCGGTETAARFLAGAVDVVQVVEPGSVTAVVNTGDDAVIHGLAISPDLDTILYTLAGAIDPDRGWGVADRPGGSWRRSAGSRRCDPRARRPGTTWFRLGDHDLATHMYRTSRLAEGARPTAVADELATAWGIDVRLLPMTDDAVATTIELAEGDVVPFQDYFVRLRHSVPVRSVSFAGADAGGVDGGRAGHPQRRRKDRHRSLQPHRLDRTAAGAAGRRRGGRPTARRRRGGVADRRWRRGRRGRPTACSRSLGTSRRWSASPGCTRRSPPRSAIDPVDTELAPAVEAAGMRPVIAEAVMSTPRAAASLAAAAITAAAGQI